MRCGLGGGALCLVVRVSSMTEGLEQASSCCRGDTWLYQLEKEMEDGDEEVSRHSPKLPEGEYKKGSVRR